MPLVRFSFLPEWRAAVLSGAKTTTVRSKRLGEAGDEFELEEVRFVIERIEAMPLSRARDAAWRTEGFASAAEFEAHWGKLHPERGFRGGDSVWVHAFRRASREDHR